MSRRHWTRTDEELHRGLADLPLDLVARALGVDRHTVRKHRDRAGIEPQQRRRWTAGEVATLRARYATERTHVIAADLARPAHQVHAKALKLGLRKDPAVIARWSREAMADPQHGGRRHLFVKGHAPTHAWRYHPNMERGRFKPGQLPPNRQEIGALRINPEGYLEVKVRHGKWRPEDGGAWKLLQRVVWEQHRGPIPPGHVVCIKGDDRHDVRIENLELLTQQEHGARSKLVGLPLPVRQLIQLRGAVVRQINRRSKA